MEIAIGRCGIACEVCRHFDRGCCGCNKENIFNNRCLIFNCTEKKKIEFCVQCTDFPCNLMRGLSKSYCPVFTEIKLY